MSGLEARGWTVVSAEVRGRAGLLPGAALLCLTLRERFDRAMLTADSTWGTQGRVTEIG